MMNSDRLLEIALRARLPEKYSERVAAKLEHCGSSGVMVVAGTMQRADWLSAFGPKPKEDCYAERS